MRAYRLGAVLLASALGVASAAVGRAQGTEEEPATAAAWIWYPERPAVEGAGQTRYLRKVVRLQGKPTEAWLRVLADDSLTFTVNGQPAPLAQERLKGGAVYDLRTVLGPGENVLGFAVHNATGPGGPASAGGSAGGRRYRAPHRVGPQLSGRAPGPRG